jgi:hypothetical protein
MERLEAAELDELAAGSDDDESVGDGSDHEREPALV